MSTKSVSQTPTTESLTPFFQREDRASQEAKIQLLSYCSVGDILKVGSTCKNIFTLVSQNPVWEGYAKKRGITLAVPEDSSPIKHLCKLVNTFSSIFPKLSNLDTRSGNALEHSLQAISEFTRLNPEIIFGELRHCYDENKIRTLVEASPPNYKIIIKDIENGQTNWKAYIRNGFPRSDQEMAGIFALVPRDMLLGRESFCMKFVQEVKAVRGERFQFSDAIIKLAVEKGFLQTALFMITEQKVKTTLFQEVLKLAHPSEVMDICTHFLSLGYKFSREDLREFLTKDCSQEKSMYSERFDRLFTKILDSVNFSSTSEDIEWAANHDSYSCFGGCFGNYSLQVIQKMIDLSPNIPNSKTFQYVLSQRFSVKTVDMFLKKGYKIASADFRFVIDKLVAHEKNASSLSRFGVYYSDPQPEVLIQLIMRDEFLECHEGGKFKPTPEDFRYMLEKRPQSHCIKRILENGYTVESADFRKVIDHASASELSSLLKEEIYGNFGQNAYMPTQSDFRYALMKDKVSWAVIEVLIKRGYKPTSDDFLLALSLDCSAAVIKTLLNEGYINHEFKHVKAGFEPTENEFKRAKLLKRDSEILDLIIERNPQLSKSRF